MGLTFQIATISCIAWSLRLKACKNKSLEPYGVYQTQAPKRPEDQTLNRKTDIPIPKRNPNPRIPGTPHLVLGTAGKLRASRPCAPERVVNLWIRVLSLGFGASENAEVIRES